MKAALDLKDREIQRLHNEMKAMAASSEQEQRRLQ